MQQQQHQEQLEHYYTNPSLNNSDLDLDINNMTSLDASNLLYRHDQSFNYSQIMTNYSKNWSERILQDITGLLHVLSPTGKILYCSSSCISIIGFQPEELVGRSLTDFIHVDDLDLFIQNFQLAFSSMSRIKIHYRLRCKNNSFVLLESIGHPKQDSVSEPPQYFFAIAQPYLSRSNGLMESFLEMKLENEWLKKRLEGFLSMSHSPPISAVEPTCSQLQINVQQSEQHYHVEQQPYAFYNNPYNSNDQQQFNHQQKLQQQLLDHQQLQYQQRHYLQQQQQLHQQQQHQQQQQQQTQINQSSRRPSIVSVKMDDQWNYSPSVASSSDLMNRYQTEETNTITATTTTTSTATTTTNTATISTSTMPIKTTATTTTASYSSSDNTLMNLPDVVRKDKWKRRKKQPNVEYLCTDCGATSSPEWRKGPHGPKTLCNACGLRWAKKNKKI
ncbi:white collar 2 type of transcription factor [Mucor circinelloides]